MTPKLADLTYPEIRDRVAEGAVALIPVGATEAHGPHLPVDTDVVIAEETCRRAGPELQSKLGIAALRLPPVAYSLTDYAAPFAGTVSIPKEVIVPFLSELIVSVSQSGYRVVCLVNAHLEPGHRHALRDAVDRAGGRATCPVVIADPGDRRWVPRMTEEFRSGACHAGRYETSLMLAAGARVRPHDDLGPVEIDLMKGMREGQSDFPSMGAVDAYFGRPAEATVEEGHATYAILADIVVSVVGEALERSSS